MKLNTEQKKVVQMINDKKFNVDWIEKFYKEDGWKLSDNGKKDTYIYDIFIKEVNTFMIAVNGLIKNLIEQN